MALTADWDPLGDVFFRRQKLYSMLWADKVDLDKFVVAAAPYGGPIALVRDEKKIPQNQPMAPKPVIYVFSAAGVEISSIRWNSGNLLGLGWSSKEDLLCIQDDGSILVYDMITGSMKTPFTMGQDAKNDRVLEFQVFSSFQGTGVAVLTASYRIFVVNNVDDPRIRRLAEVQGLTKPPSSWIMINHDRQSRALVAKESSLYLLDHGGQCEQQVVETSAPVGSFISMAVSFNHKYLALFSSSGVLWIGSSDLQKVYCEYDTQRGSRPLQLVWCGTGAVVCYWEDLMLMVGPRKDSQVYSYESPCYLLPEMDGLRIIGHEDHEFLEKVPAVTEDIFKIGSIASGALLYEASREFQRGSQQSDEYIRMIKDKLPEAVEQCVEAARHEWEPEDQKALLRAASFGKCFLTDYRSETFRDMCQMLRVLNAVRQFRVGLPLTYTQLQNLKLNVLIDRLVMRRQFCLAIEVCKYLSMPEADGSSRILAHWACYKVKQQGVADEQVALAIKEKLGDSPGVSYSEIASQAYESNRIQLAIRLLDFEARAGEQVPLLMKMKKNDLALSKATESGDTDLVYMVLLRLKKDMTTGDFLMAIRNLPTAHALYMQYCRDSQPKLLHDVYCMEDNFLEQANCCILSSYEDQRLDQRTKFLEQAQDNYTKARNETAAKLCEEQVKLVRYQRKMEEELNLPFLDLSLHRTMTTLLTRGSHKWAEVLRKEFKVPDRRFWWLKVKCMTEAGEWLELEKFSKSKKSPIGYEPFVEACVEQGNPAEAIKYLAKVSPENRVKCHVKVGQLNEAAELAFQNQNVEELNCVFYKCGTANKALAEKIVGMRAQLTAGKR